MLELGYINRSLKDNTRSTQKQIMSLYFIHYKQFQAKRLILNYYTRTCNLLKHDNFRPYYLDSLYNSHQLTYK